MPDLATEIINYAALLNEISARSRCEFDGGIPSQSDDICSEDIKRLLSIAKKRKNNRSMLLNSVDGLPLRLGVQNHEPRQGEALYCALFGQNSPPKRGHCSSFFCSQFGTTLCIRIHPGFRRSCWVTWNSHKEVKLLVTPHNPSTGRRMESSHTFGSSRASLRQTSNIDAAVSSTDGQSADNTNDELHGSSGGEGQEQDDGERVPSMAELTHGD